MERGLAGELPERGRRVVVNELFGQSIDPTLIDSEQVEGRNYWELSPVEYMLEQQKKEGFLLAAPVIGYESVQVKTPQGEEFAMSPAIYRAEILLDKNYRILMLRFFRLQYDESSKSFMPPHEVAMLPGPLVDDFVMRLKKLIEGNIRVVSPSSFQALDEALPEEDKKEKKSGRTKTGKTRSGSKGRKKSSSSSSGASSPRKKKGTDAKKKSR